MFLKASFVGVYKSRDCVVELKGILQATDLKCSKVTFNMPCLFGQSAFTCVLVDQSFPTNQSHDHLNFTFPLQSSSVAH